uniref:C2H2-type domain-containing protein n=1 Tax=Panagrolaimus sp. ES5 TaxID=591445 RepID=A0AC34F5B3_9BILA
MVVYQCPVCNESQLTLKLHRKHVRDTHVKGLEYLVFTCRHCGKKDMTYDWYRKHIGRCVPENIEPVMPTEDNENDMNFDDNFQMEAEEKEEVVFQQDHIKEVLDNVKEMFDSLWLSLLSSPDVTCHTVDIVCGIVSDMLKKALDLLKPNLPDYEKAQKYFTQQWSKTKSEYMRKQGLYKSGDFVQPEKYALNDRLEPVATFDGNI